MSNLIPLKAVEGERRVDSRLLSEELGVTNRACVKLIQLHQKDFEEFGVLAFQMLKPTPKTKGGRPELLCFLNRDQSHLYLTYSRNTPKARKLKIKLVKTFSYYERALSRAAMRKGQRDWQQTRAEGKVVRQEERVTIEKFVAYAIIQGSRNAKMYYVNIPTMVNKALFFLELVLPKPNNFRDLLSRIQLIHLSTADNLVVKALEEGMKGGMPYKEIYKLAKEKVEAFAGIVGKTRVLEITVL